jgi:hypothetical protein
VPSVSRNTLTVRSFWEGTPSSHDRAGAQSISAQPSHSAQALGWDRCAAAALAQTVAPSRGAAYKTNQR